MNYKYDVFISYSRKDYCLENGEVIPGNPISAIQDMLEKNHIPFWFDKDGIYSGDEFIKVITDAIVDSKMLIFVSSKNSNMSEWTTGEILMAKKRQKTILPVKIDDSDYNSKFELVLLAYDFINYYESEQESLAKILKSIKKNNEGIARQQVRAEIQELANDCLVLLNQQDALVKTLVEKNLSVGITIKDCPVCGKSTPLDDAFCGRCGWRFPVLYALGGSQITAGDKRHLTLARANWQKVADEAASVAERQKIELENNQLRKTLESISAECQALTDSLSRRESDLRSIKTRGEELHKQLADLQKIRKELHDENANLKRQLSKNADEQAGLRNELSIAQEELSRTKAELESKQQEIRELKKQTSITRDSDFDVVLRSAGAAKLQVVKTVKEVLHLDLKVAKDLVDGAPSVVAKRVDYPTALMIMNSLEDSGGEVELKPLAATVTATTSGSGDYSVVLGRVGAQKLQAVKLVMEACNLPLNRAKVLVDRSPSILREKVPYSTAQSIKRTIETCGAKVYVCPSKEAYNKLREL